MNSKKSRKRDRVVTPGRVRRQYRRLDGKSLLALFAVVAVLAAGAISYAAWPGNAGKSSRRVTRATLPANSGAPTRPVLRRSSSFEWTPGQIGRVRALEAREEEVSANRDADKEERRHWLAEHVKREMSRKH